MSLETDGHRYGTSFFDYVDSSSGRSAAAVLARVSLGFEPSSVLDVGCGRGAWLVAWKTRGAGSVLGLDGAYVDPRTVRLAPGEFKAADLSAPFDLGRRFDLVQCLEVAEHLPPAAAAGLVNSLARHGDVVLFSAAPPGQGGEHHVNEQPLAYWAALFREQGYALFDCIRPNIQGFREIEPWYRYNTVVFANDAGARRLVDAARATRLADGEQPREWAPAAWRLRCRVVRCLPTPVVELLARARHLFWRQA